MVELKDNNQKERVFREVRKCLVAALGVEENQVTSEASLIRDLGAESIDFLDIIFRLEKEFNIKIPRGDLFPENIFTNATFVKDGVVTAAGLAELKKKNPYADFSVFEKDPQVSKLSDTFTVGMITNYVCAKIGSAH
jgi:acyl carrier protein